MLVEATMLSALHVSFLCCRCVNWGIALLYWGLGLQHINLRGCNSSHTGLPSGEQLRSPASGSHLLLEGLTCANAWHCDICHFGGRWRQNAIWTAEGRKDNLIKHLNWSHSKLGLWCLSKYLILQLPPKELPREVQMVTLVTRAICSIWPYSFKNKGHWSAHTHKN